MKKLILIFYVIISFKTLSVENLRFEVEKIDENLVLVNIVGVEKKEIKNDFEEYPYHKVRKGEYLNKIAKDYQKRPAKLVQINELKNPNLIYPKQKIYLEKKKSIDIEKIPKYHIVQRGENIISIALEYELDWKQILRLNSLEKCNRYISWSKDSIKVSFGETND